METKVIWSEAATQDLRDICTYIAKESPQAAERVGNAILDHVDLLASFPLIGPTYPRGSRGLLREIVNPPYRIFYEVSEDGKIVKLLHVRHGSREQPRVDEIRGRNT